MKIAIHMKISLKTGAATSLTIFFYLFHSKRYTMPELNSKENIFSFTDVIDDYKTKVQYTPFKLLIFETGEKFH